MLLATSCSSFLNEKSDQKLAVPSTLRDFQALMENSTYIHHAGPSEGEVSSDDYYLTTSDWMNLGYVTDRNTYVWAEAIEFTDKVQSGWTTGYRTIYYCNSVLEGLSKFDDEVKKSTESQNIAGQAHFFRGNSLFDIAQIWTKPYEIETANTSLGLPLRLNSDFNQKVERSNLTDTYEQIIGDIKKAISFLPIESGSKWRPSKAGAYGLLARIYLAMREYEEAGKYADSCLNLYSSIIDYNSLDLTSNVPIPPNNDEVISYRSMSTVDPIRVTMSKIDTTLYGLYHDNDLRRRAFFRFRDDGTIRYQGSYLGTTGFFNGIATNEIYLIKAESLARQGNIEQATSVMDKLLTNRYKKIDNQTTWTGASFDTNEKLIDFILLERRKELVMRGLRWIDVRRLNSEGRKINLRRVIDGKDYDLPAGDNRFALPIPADVIRISGIEQNDR